MAQMIDEWYLKIKKIIVQVGNLVGSDIPKPGHGPSV